MKLHKYILLLFLMCVTQALTAQEKPYNSMIFRSQIFDNSHQPVKNENLKVEVDLFTKDKVWYSESQQINTNNEGLVFIQVGKGSSIVGNFNEVPFSNQEISLRIKYKILNSNGASGNYVQLQSTDLYAVPYAFHALTAESVTGKLNNNSNSGASDQSPTGDSGSTSGSKGNTWSVYGNKYISMRDGFLGTVDSSPLNFKTNNQTRINITPEGKINFLGDINIGNANTVTIANLVTENITANNATINNLITQTGVIESTVQSTNPDTGALIVKGGTGIKKNLNIGENLTVSNNTNLLGNLQVNGNSGFLEKADFNKQLKINDLTESGALHEGSLVTMGGASIAKNVNIGGNSNVSGNVTASQNVEIGQNLKVNGSENATNKDHGALIVETGGLGVEKDVVAGGNIKSNANIIVDNNLEVANIANLNALNVSGNSIIHGTTQILNNTFSANPTQGALVVQGGVGIGENLNVAQNANIAGILTTNNLSVNDIIQINGAADAVDQNSGALIVTEGGLGVEKNIHSGKNITANGNLNSVQNTNVGQNLSVGANTTTNNLTVSNATTLGGITNITNGTHSTNPSTGALIVGGGLGVNENVNIGQNLNTGGNLNVAQNANITGTLTANNLALNNTLQINGTADAVDQNSGALVVTEGGLGVEKSIYSGKNITAVQNITANGNLNSLQNTNVGQNLSVGANTTTNNLTVNNTTTVGGITNITNGTHSTNPSTGALIVGGGLGVNENVNIGQNLNTGGNLNVAQNANITGTLTANNLSLNNTLQINGTADAVDQNSGALVVTEGGLGVEKSIYSGKNITAVQNITANGNLNSLQNTNVGQNLSVAANTTTNSLAVNNNTTLGGITNITNATHSINSSTGALVVAGGLGVNENINIGQDLNVSRDTNLNGNLYTNKLSTFNDNSIFNKQVEIKSSIDSDNDKALEVDGGAIVGKRLYIKSTLNQPYGDFTNAALKVDGGAIVNGNLSVLGQVFAQNATVNTLTPLSVDTFTYYNNPYQRPLLNNKGFGPDNIFDSYTLKVNAVDQGIAIKVNKHAQSNHGAAYGAENSVNATTGNNFISFWNKDGVMLGRIEAESLPELESFNSTYLRIIKDKGIEITNRVIIDDFKAIETAIEQYERLKAAKSKKTSDGLLNVTGTTPLGGPLVGGQSAQASEAQLEKSIDEINAAEKLAAKIVLWTKDIAISTETINHYDEQLAGLRNSVGVKYSSSAGDYAEYLELMDYNDSQKIIPAHVVGVKGGKISFNTSNCDKIMVVSMNPAVVGKEPSKENRSKFKPVAFMGQVPVFVLNKSKIGDYIIPSGNNDGYAIAKPAEMMKIDDYKKIIGIAWEETNASKIINVAVGINTNDVVGVIKEQEKQIATLESRITQIEKYLAKNSAASFTGQSIDENIKNDNDRILSVISKDSNIDKNFQKIVTRVIENLKNKNIDSLENKDIYIENEVNNYFGGMFFDKEFNNKLTFEEQKLFTSYFKIIVEQVKVKLM